MQRLLYAARWDADAVRDELVRFVAESFGDADGIFVMDETGFLKKGTKSVGVQRQYTGTAGKTENCQVGVFLTYVGPQGHAFLDRRLYLPQSWAEDRTRRAEAAVPEAVTFQTKPELAWAMLEHARALGMPGRWVTADTVYGQDPALRERLDAWAPGCHYVLAIPATTPIWTEHPPSASARIGAVRVSRTWTAHTAASVATTLTATAWRWITVAAGSKEPRTYDWVRRAWRSVTAAGQVPSTGCWSAAQSATPPSSRTT